MNVEANNQVDVPVTVPEQRVIQISKKKVTRWLVALIILVLLVTLIMFVGRSMLRRTTFGIASGGVLTSNMMVDQIPGMLPEPSPRNRRDITDTREFLKVSYSSSIQTRQVERVMGEAEDAIRLAGGRIDYQSVNEKRGSISFVAPKSEFYRLQNDLEDIVHPKLYTESITSVNKLDQKQQIEQQQDYNTLSLDEAKTERSRIISTYTSQKSSYETQTKDIESTINDLMTVRLSTEDPNIIDGLQLEEDRLRLELSQMRSRFSYETQQYNSQLGYINSRIETLENYAENLDERDEDFANDIETVNGQFSAQWVSLWGMARIFLPFPPALVFVALFLLWVWWARRTKRIPKIQLV